MNPYPQFIAEQARFLKEAKSFPLGDFPPAPRPDLAFDAPRVLIFSPHPDDECIVGGLALRLMREARMSVVNVAVTQGSNPARRAERLTELENACHYLGFGLTTTGAVGLEKINAATREHDPAHWAECVKVIAEILITNQPRVVLFPHELDWNVTHIGTHFLVLDALKHMPVEFECHLVETEFWGALATPNLMVELGAADLGDLVSALTFHVGEVKRNPYHLFIAPWMMDNVRRAEKIGGQGTAAPDFTFATIYRLRKWSQGRVTNVLTGGKFLSKAANPAQLFE